MSERGRKPSGWRRRGEQDLPADFFSPRWISPYILESIRRCGDISLAYEIYSSEAKRKR